MQPIDNQTSGNGPLSRDADSAATQPHLRFLHEAGALLKLGAPIVATQLAQTGMSFVDTVMAGRYSEQDLAAVAIGSSIWVPSFLAMAGLLMATTPLVAQAFGAGRHAQINSYVQQALWLALAAGILTAAGLNHTAFIFSYLGVSAEVQEIAVKYLQGLSWGLPAVALYQVLRSCNEGLHRTRPIMYVSFIALGCNIPLNYVLIYGKLGLPALGGEGCGIATAIVMWMQLLVLAGLTFRSRIREQLSLLYFIERPQLAVMVEILKLGIPMGFAIFIEASMFSLIALFLADLGSTVVSGHQVTISFTSLVFMCPLSMSIAMTIRTGYALGMGQPLQARFISQVGLTLTFLFALATSSLMFFFPQHIASLYSDSLPVQEIAISLLSLAAIFQFSDALQVSAAGALRGYKDTRVPLLAVFFAYWVVGLPLGLMLGRTDWLYPAMGAQGFWIGLIIGLTVAALLLGWRLQAVGKRALKATREASGC